MSLKKLFSLVFVFIFLAACSYQENVSFPGAGKQGVNKTEEINPADTPANDLESPSDIVVSREEIVNNDGEVVIRKKLKSLVDKELFDLWDLFFDKFIVPVNAEGEGFDTRVDYESLHELNSKSNRLYVHLVNSIERKMKDADLSDKSKEYKTAFYLNAYNYSAIRAVNRGYIKRGKKISSIKKLSRGLNPYEIFSRRSIPVAGEVLSLDNMEKGKVKDLMTSGANLDSRFHFAVICASGGCPVTLNKAYREESLEEDLTFVTTEGLRLPRMVQNSTNRLAISKIFSWYQADFKKDQGSTKDFLANYGVKDTRGNISYLNYDWNLNILKTKRELPDLSELEVLKTIEVTPEEDAASDDIIDASCEDKEGYELVISCFSVEKSTREIRDAKVCLYKNEKKVNRFHVTQAISFEKGKANKFKSSFKAKEVEGVISEKEGFLGRKNLRFDLNEGSYSFRQKLRGKVELTLGCE